MFTPRSSILLLALLLTACNGSDVVVTPQNDDTATGADDTATHQNGSVGYSTVATGIWPPQPVGVSNVKAFLDEIIDSPIREIKLNSDEAIALKNPAVLSLLGHRYEVVARHSRNNKQHSNSVTEVEIFSYDNNLLVTVGVAADKRVTTTVQPATDYQPPHSVKEEYRAIALAASHLQHVGHPVDQLIGTALLAHPTAAEYKNDGNLFYPQRIIYVTFGHGEGTTPLFRATVNLSTHSVSKAGPL